MSNLSYLPQIDLPAYFLEGPRSGQSLPISGAPTRLGFPVARDYSLDLFPAWKTRSSYGLPIEQTDEYERLQAVILYRYAGRF